MGYSKKEIAEFKNIQIHLKVLEARTKRLKKLIMAKKKQKYYNITERKNLLKMIKKAKLNIASAEFI